MSGSPKTMNRLPVPVFLSSSSPIARSGFIRAWRIVSRPSVRGLLPRQRVEREAAHDEQVGELDGLLGGVADELRADGAELGADRDRDRLGRAVLAVLPDALDPGAGIGVEPAELEPLGALRVLDAGPAQVVEDARDEGAGVDRRDRLGRRGVLGAVDHDPMGRQALDRERARHADDLASPRTADRTASRSRRGGRSRRRSPRGVMPSRMSGFWAIDFRVTCGTRS